MPTKNYYEGVKHLVEIDSDMSKRCEHCDFMTHSSNLAEAVNHYIQEHAYKLLHVGQQTTRDDVGNLWQLTSAIVGK